MHTVPYVQVDLRSTHALLHTAGGDVRLPRDLALAVADALTGRPADPIRRAVLSPGALRVSWPSASMILPAGQAGVLAHVLRDWAAA